MKKNRVGGVSYFSAGFAKEPPAVRTGDPEFGASPRKTEERDKPMKAVVKEKTGYGIKVGDAAVPKPGPGEVLVRVEAVGICGSDLHIYEWTPGYEAIAPYFPRILGHEFSGEIVEIGEGSKGEFKRGEKVTSETCKSCGQCFYCKQGNGILCLQRFVSGRIGFERDGAMAEYVVVSEECLHRIPAGVTMEEAAMTEPAAVALGAVERGSFDPGDLVVISGPGPIGLMALQFCKALGAGRVVVVGLEADRRRLEVATKLGADAGAHRVPRGKSSENYGTGPAGWGRPRFLKSAARRLLPLRVSRCCAGSEPWYWSGSIRTLSRLTPPGRWSAR